MSQGRPTMAKLCDFVCTRRECKDRLTCPVCLLTEHSEHFQWMVGIDEFFNPKSKNKPEDNKGDDKYNMLDFVQDKEGLDNQVPAEDGKRE